MPTKRDFEFERSKTVERGHTLSRQLASLFVEKRFPFEFLQKYGALAVDVEYGQELVALHSLAAAPLIISEPISEVEDEVDTSALKRAVLERLLLLYSGATLIDGTFSQVVTYLEEHFTDHQFALVTRLNAFPTFLSREEIRSFIEITLPHVIGGGLILISSLEGDYLKEFEQVIEERIEGVTLFFDKHSDLRSIGTMLLVAQKNSL